MGIEVIIALGSFLVTSVMKIFAAKSADNSLIMKAALNNHKEEAAERAAMNALDTPSSFAFTRRIIALTVIFSIVAVPTLTPLIGSLLGIVTPVVSNCSMNPDTTSLLFGLFSFSNAEMECIAGSGILLLPWHSQIVAIVIGAYFGDKVGNR
jgi:hypothetical protein